VVSGHIARSIRGVTARLNDGTISKRVIETEFQFHSDCPATLFNNSNAECRRRCRHGQRTVASGVSDNIDRLSDKPDDRIMNANTVSAMADINVLIVVGLRAASVNRELAKVAIDSSADGIALNTFDSLTNLPCYSETFEHRGTPSSVAALRTAATEADAVLMVTTYHGRLPAGVHNAIDWLTRRWDQASLNDKPLAVIGRASGCYSGVWSHQTDDADLTTGPRVIESITVSDLCEAVKKLACEVRAGTGRWQSDSPPPQESTHPSPTPTS
jgi:hypothetical protein